MSTATDQKMNNSLTSIAALNRTTAANEDHLPSLNPATNAWVAGSQEFGATGGWNAYDVWRRLIKEARERREGQHDAYRG